jgi:hypothetical protein
MKKEVYQEYLRVIKDALNKESTKPIEFNDALLDCYFSPELVITCKNYNLLNGMSFKIH